MDFAEQKGAKELRAQVAEFLAAELPPAKADEVYRTGESHDDDIARALAARGWLARDGMAEGPALDAFENHALTDELTGAETPTYAVETGMMVCNVIQAVGTPWLREQVLPGAIRGEITIALGMTEPETGSDVAAVRTKARRDGDEWVIDGSKMFTTNAHVADYVFLLTRTDPETTNHKGLTTFLVPLDTPGIEVQKVETLSGERTNITYYSDVRLDDRWRIGEVDQGWGALMVALQDEHSAAFSAHLGRLLGAAEAWAARGAEGRRPIDDPEVAEALARAAADLEVARLLEWRTTWMEAEGQVPLAEGPMSKLFSTEAAVVHSERIAELVGPDALRSRLEPTALEDGQIEHALRFAVGMTIYAGTSEVQRNIIARQGLGLPR